MSSNLNKKFFIRCRSTKKLLEKVIKIFTKNLLFSNKPNKRFSNLQLKTLQISFADQQKIFKSSIEDSSISFADQQKIFSFFE